MASAEAKRIVDGFGDGTFRGDEDVTVEQMLAIAARTLIDRKGYTEPEDEESYLRSFTDGGAVSAWARKQVAMSVRDGLQDRGGALNPLASVTRAQAAEILYRLFLMLYEVQPVALTMPETAAEETETAAEAENRGLSAGKTAAVAGAAFVALGGGGAACLLTGRKKNKLALFVAGGVLAALALASAVYGGYRTVQTIRAAKAAEPEPAETAAPTALDTPAPTQQNMPTPSPAPVEPESAPTPTPVPAPTPTPEVRIPGAGDHVSPMGSRYKIPEGFYIDEVKEESEQYYECVYVNDEQEMRISIVEQAYDDSAAAFETAWKRYDENQIPPVYSRHTETWFVASGYMEEEETNVYYTQQRIVGKWICSYYLFWPNANRPYCEQATVDFAGDFEWP